MWDFIKKVFRDICSAAYGAYWGHREGGMELSGGFDRLAGGVCVRMPHCWWGIRWGRRGHPFLWDISSAASQTSADTGRDVKTMVKVACALTDTSDNTSDIRHFRWMRDCRIRLKNLMWWVPFLLCRKYRFDISCISTKSTSPIESAKPTLFCREHRWGIFPEFQLSSGY